MNNTILLSRLFLLTLRSIIRFRSHMVFHKIIKAALIWVQPYCVKIDV